MKKIILILLIVLSLSLASCKNNKKKDDKEFDDFKSFVNESIDKAYLHDGDITVKSQSIPRNVETGEENPGSPVTFNYLIHGGWSWIKSSWGDLICDLTNELSFEYNETTGFYEKQYYKDSTTPVRPSSWSIMNSYSLSYQYTINRLNADSDHRKLTIEDGVYKLETRTSDNKAVEANAEFYYHVDENGQKVLDRFYLLYHYSDTTTLIFDVTINAYETANFLEGKQIRL